MKRKATNAVQVASLIAIACSLFEKLLGLLREVKIAEILGISTASDAYNVAYLLVITVFGLFSAAYSNSLMPIATESYINDKHRMNKTVNHIVTMTMIVIMALIVIVSFCPTLFVKMIAAGLNNETTELSARLVKISVWSLLALTINAAYTIVMRVFEHNLVPTVSELIFPIPVLVALFCNIHSPELLISCVVVGYYLRSVILIVSSRCVGFIPRIQLRSDESVFYHFVKMMPPMLLSSGLLQINTLVDNQVASKFETGSVTALALASKVNGLAYTVFATSLMQIVYAAMAKAYLSKDIEQMRAIVKKQVRLILAFVVPCAIILYQYSDEIIQILFMRGQFNIDNAKMAGGILKGYAIGLVVFVLRDICIYIYYSAKNSKFPSLITGITVAVNIVLNLLFSWLWGIKGVSYATSVSALIAFVVLKIHMREKVAEISFISKKSGIVIAVSALGAWLTASNMQQLLRSLNVWFSFFAFALTFIVFWGLYFGGLLVASHGFIKRKIGS